MQLRTQKVIAYGNMLDENYMPLTVKVIRIYYQELLSTMDGSVLPMFIKLLTLT